MRKPPECFVSDAAATFDERKRPPISKGMDASQLFKTPRQQSHAYVPYIHRKNTFICTYVNRYFTDLPDSNPPREGTSPAKALAAGITLPETSPGDGWAQDIGAIQTKVCHEPVLGKVL